MQKLLKIVGQDDQINYMWRRDPIQWANSAPILFPIVGALQNNECRIDGKTYTMTQHGFSRHSEYEANQINDQEVVFTLISNEEIAKQYPYLFKLDVTYKLDRMYLAVIVKLLIPIVRLFISKLVVILHLACPFMKNESSNDYYLEFSENETVNQKLLMLNIKECQI